MSVVVLLVLSDGGGSVLVNLNMWVIHIWQWHSLILTQTIRLLLGRYVSEAMGLLPIFLRVHRGVSDGSSGSDLLLCTEIVYH